LRGSSSAHPSGAFAFALQSDSTIAQISALIFLTIHTIGLMDHVSPPPPPIFDHAIADARKEMAVG